MYFVVRDYTKINQIIIGSQILVDAGSRTVFSVFLSVRFRLTTVLRRPPLSVVDTSALSSTETFSMAGYLRTLSRLSVHGELQSTSLVDCNPMAVDCNPQSRP